MTLLAITFFNTSCLLLDERVNIPKELCEWSSFLQHKHPRCFCANGDILLVPQYNFVFTQVSTKASFNIWKKHAKTVLV